MTRTRDWEGKDQLQGSQAVPLIVGLALDSPEVPSVHLQNGAENTCVVERTELLLSSRKSYVSLASTHFKVFYKF